MNGDGFSEFSLIDKIKSGFSELVKGGGVVGIGDDCAIIPQNSGKDTLVSADLLVEGVHFILPDVQAAAAGISTDNEPGSIHKGSSINKEAQNSRVGGISAYELGWKSAAVNISDIAGMGGKPVATFLSIAVPERIRTMSVRRFPDQETCVDSCKGNQEVRNSNEDETYVPWLEEFFRGYKAISSKFGVALLGGDTTSSLDKLCINVTVLGECEHDKAVRRKAAQAGDLICVTGNLGDSAAGLKLLLSNNAMCARTETIQCANAKVNPLHASDNKERLLHKHYMPEPRVKEGIALAKVQGIGAMMDISDGIASDLKHILEESNACRVKSRCMDKDGQQAESESTGSQSYKTYQQNLIAIVDVNRLPLSDCMKRVCEENGWDQIELAVGGGEDYELLFTCRPDAQIPVEHYVIGEIIEQSNGREDIIWKGTDRNFSGFNHF